MTTSADGTSSNDASLSDHQLIESIQNGSSIALAQLYDRHASRMLGCAHQILGNRNDAEDVLHDVFIEVWRLAASYDPQRGSVVGWLFLRLRSRSIDRRRALMAARDRRLVNAEPDDYAAPAAYSDPVLQSEQALAREALQGLTDVQRSVLELGYFQGLTCVEIADRCQIPIGTVKSRLAAALASLRRTFAERGGKPDAR